jgi:hypothetical protein
LSQLSGKSKRRLFNNHLNDSTMSTATATKPKKGKNTEMTPEEQVAMYAQNYLHTCERIAQLEEDKAALKEHLEDYYQETKNANIAGLLTVQERASGVKLTGASGKRMDMLKEQLIRELPKGYVKEEMKLDLGRMYASVDTDASLRALLREAGLNLEQNTIIVLKAA